MKTRTHLLQLLPYFFLMLAIYLLYRQLAEVNFDDFRRELKSWPRSDLQVAVALTFCSFVALAGYDFLSLRHLGKRLPLKEIFLTSFAAFSISNIVGHSLLSGSSVRLQRYARAGLSLSEVAALGLFNTLTFWVGFAFLLAVALLFGPPAPKLDAFGLSPRNWGIIVALLSAAYFALSATWGGKIISIRRWTLKIPGLRMSLEQVALGTLDLCVCAAVFYTLLPAGISLSYDHFLAYFLIAQMLGLLSQVPGGLGVLDGLLLRFLSPYANAHQLVVSILLFRLVYYLLPLAITFFCKIAYALLRYRGSGVPVHTA